MTKNFLENIKLPDGTLLSINTVPAGGQLGQVLIKTGTGEQDLAWGEAISATLTEQISDIDTFAKGNAKSIADEATRAKEVEQELDGKIDAEKTAREAKDAELAEADGANAGAIEALNGVITISKADLAGLVARLGALEARVGNIGKTNVKNEVVTPPAEGEEAPVFNDATADFVISGTITEAETSKIVAKSLELNETKVENNVRLNIKATEDVTIAGSEWAGSFPKASGNEVASVNADGHVVIKDCVVDAKDAYNGLGIGLMGGVAKSILIDNVDFKGAFSNNAINIYGTANNAVITISNCHFTAVSNMLRISNNQGGKVTINIINCTVDKWDITPDWAGLICCQDYTSKTAEEAIANNLFGADKVTININNLVGPYGKVEAPADMAEVCGSKIVEKQLIMVTVDKNGGLQPYNEANFPKLNIQ
jgi:hypothetical protein